MADILLLNTKILDDGSNQYTYVTEKSDERTTLLIADFSGEEFQPGYTYANGWKFSVPSSFKDALDIKLTTVTINGKPTRAWTQGGEFSFKVGDTIHSSNSKHIVQVDTATPRVSGKIETTVNSNTPEMIQIVQKKRNEGQVKFRVYLGNVPGGFYKCTQAEFIRLLMTGKFKPLTKHADIDLLQCETSSLVQKKLWD